LRFTFARICCGHWVPDERFGALVVLVDSG
jgi:hypothetical protein